MHSSFPDWYRAAQLKPDGDLITKRWAAINTFEPSRATMLDLARVFYNIGSPSADFITAFRATFQKKDVTFPAKGNDVEMQVLAGAELVDSWGDNVALWSSYAALTVVCSSCRGLRSPKVPEILELAVQRLGERCGARFDAAKLGKSADLSAEAQKALKTSCDQGTVPPLGPPLVVLMQEMARLRTAVTNHQQQLELQSEETNILWWMMGEHGRDGGVHFSDLPASAACLTVGKDLADLVRVAPGPLAAQAFLERALRLTSEKPDASVRIKDAVNAIAPEQREQWLSTSRWDDALADFCPLHHALRLSLSSAEKDAWLPAFEKSTGLQKEAALSGREVAYQMYLEGVLHRAWSTIGPKG